MKFIVDEDMSPKVVDELRRKGYEAVHIRNIEPGVENDEVLRITNRENAILITEDRELTERIKRGKGEKIKAVISLWPGNLLAKQEIKMTLEAIEKYKEKPVEHITRVTTERCYQESLQIENNFSAG